MYGEVCSTHNNNKNNKNNNDNNNNNNTNNNNNLYSHHPQDHEHLCTSHKPTLQLSPRTAQNYTEPKNLLKSSRPLRAPASHRPFSVTASKRHAASQRRAAIQRRSVAASRRHPASQRRSAKQRRSVAPAMQRRSVTAPCSVAAWLPQSASRLNSAGAWPGPLSRGTGKLSISAARGLASSVAASLQFFKSFSFALGEKTVKRMSKLM